MKRSFLGAMVLLAACNNVNSGSPVKESSAAGSSALITKSYSCTTTDTAAVGDVELVFKSSAPIGDVLNGPKSIDAKSQVMGAAALDYNDSEDDFTPPANMLLFNMSGWGDGDTAFFYVALPQHISGAAFKAVVIEKNDQLNGIKKYKYSCNG